MSRRAALAATRAMLVERIEMALTVAAMADHDGHRTVRDRAKQRVQAYRAALADFDRIVAEHVKED